MSLQISIIGAGNVATQLALGLYKSGFKIIQVYSRSEESAEALAAKVRAIPITSMKKLIECDVCFVSLPDDVTQDVLSEYKIANALLIHTSGTLSKDFLACFAKNYGVLYPLQTISKNRNVDWTLVPVFIEGNNKKSLQQIKKIGCSLSYHVSELNSEKRMALHVSAVFACNFTNHMLALSYKILEENLINPEVLSPLIDETVRKIQRMHPADAQTGPAQRGDKNILKKHCDFLQAYPDLKKMYSFVSASIAKNKKQG